MHIVNALVMVVRLPPFDSALKAMRSLFGIFAAHVRK
jgi:hypothetical protein